MGCCGGKAAGARAPRPEVVLAAGVPAAPSLLARHAAGQSIGQNQKLGMFQVRLSKGWQDYGPEEDQALKKAFLVGQPHCRICLRGQEYEYSFKDMQQTNLDTGKTRDIRPPRGMRAPAAPLLPPGPMVVITVPEDSAGKEIEIDDPNNSGRKLLVNVPPGAAAGQRMAVPVPRPGEAVETVQDKQRSHGASAKLAMGVAGLAAVSGLAVGGVVLGSHLAGDEFDQADVAATDMAEAATDWAEDAAEGPADWATGGVEAGEWAEGVFDNLVDLFENAGEDIETFVADLF